MSRTVLLGDIAQIFDGPHATPKKTASGPVFLGISNLNYGRLDLSSTEHLNEADLGRWNKRTVPRPGDIVFSYETRLGQAAMIPEGFYGCLGRRMGLLRVDPTRVDKDYLLYYWLSPQFQAQIQAKKIHGSTVERIALTELPKFEVSLPDIETQRQIAQALKSVDEKIELNRRMNETLEQMGQALFRHYFISSPETGSEMPVGDLIRDALGGDWGKEEPDSSHTQRVRIIRGTDIGNIKNGIVQDVPDRYVEVKKYLTRQLQPNDIVIEISGGSNTQSTGRSIFITKEILNLLGGYVIPASFCRVIRTKSDRHAVLLAVFLENLYAEGEMWNYQNRSTGISNFQFTYFTENAKLPYFHPDTLETFYDEAKEILKLRSANAQEIQSLTILRDALLPRLISGKLNI